VHQRLCRQWSFAKASDRPITATPGGGEFAEVKNRESATAGGVGESYSGVSVGDIDPCAPRSLDNGKRGLVSERLHTFLGFNVEDSALPRRLDQQCRLRRVR
jgi:hypothetical protein